MEQIIAVTSEYAGELFAAGMIFMLLFQIILLQRMKKIGKQLKTNEEKIVVFTEKISNKWSVRQQTNIEAKANDTEDFSGINQQEITKDLPEALIDEVLTEVFS